MYPRAHASPGHVFFGDEKRNENKIFSWQRHCQYPTGTQSVKENVTTQSVVTRKIYFQQIQN